MKQKRSRLSTELFAAVRKIDPIGVQSRKQDLNRQRGKYIVSGPNKVQLVDGYHKLSEFGLKIYAGIDAYFRYVPWSHLEVCTCMEVSMYWQYLDIIEDTGIMPSVICSDGGTETPIMAQVHFQLQLGEKDERDEMTDEELEKAFRK